MTCSAPGHDLSRNPLPTQRLCHRLFLIRRADRHLCALGFHLVAALARKVPMLPPHLRDVQRRDVQTGPLLDTRLNLAVGRLALVPGDSSASAPMPTLAISSGFYCTKLMTVSTWLDRPEMMSDFPCVRGNCSTPEIGEIRLTSNPEPKGSPFLETGQYNSFATI